MEGEDERRRKRDREGYREAERERDRARGRETRLGAGEEGRACILIRAVAFHLPKLLKLRGTI